MQQRVSNEAQAQSTRQEYLNLSKRPDETTRRYADRAWRLSGSLTETLTGAQVKLQAIKGMPSKLQAASALAKSQHFEAMVSPIEQGITAGVHYTRQEINGAHRASRGREDLQMVEKTTAEDLSELHDHQRR